MRILFVCGREPGYIRNQMVLKALRQHAEVIEVTDNSSNYVVRHVRLLYKFLRNLQPHDIVFVGFYGYLLVFLARLFSHRPLVFDAYLSTYNTLCFDRRRFHPNSLLGRITFWMDKLACHLSDVVLLDTRAHLDYFVKTYSIPPQKFAVLYLGCDEELFFPRFPPSNDSFKVFYYGSFLPVQGIEYIVHAANLLKHVPEITFQIAGNGMQYAEINALVESLQCYNIEFINWIPYEDIPNYIAQASVCLGGHFSNNSKAQNVIATKTYQFLAMAKPTIVGDSPANAEGFVHGEHVYMCRMADPDSLADSILTLWRNPALRQKIAEGGYIRFIERYSTLHVSRFVKEIIDSVYAPVSC